MVGIGIIGVGRWGRNLLRAFAGLDEVKACSVRSRDVSELVARYPRVRWTRRYRDILADPSVGAVAVATPAATHYSIAKQALEAGKHVFVEKPLCQKSGEAADLVKLSRKKKKILMVGHIFLYHPVHEAVAKVHRKDPIVSLFSEWSKLGTFEEDIVSSLVSHEAALSMGLLGARPRQTRVIQRQGLASRADRIEVELTYSGKRRHLIRIDRLHPFPSRTVRIETQGGNVYYWRDHELLRFDRRRRDFRKVFSSAEEPLQRECRAFLRAIRLGKPPRADAVFGGQVVAVLGGLLASRRHHRP